MLEAHGVAELGGQRVALVVEHVAEHDACAFGHEGPHFGFPLTACGTSDDRDLAGEPATPVLAHARIITHRAETCATCNVARAQMRGGGYSPRMGDIIINGTCDARFDAVRDAFAANFTNGLELGAGLSVSVEGRNVVDLWAGWLDEAATRPWERDSLACIFSCTKGVVAIVALVLADRGELDLDAPVAHYWPEFAQNGKSSIPVRWLLTHEAGVSAIEEKMPFGSLSDWTAMTDALAAQHPMWEPGSDHGYHGVTFGHLIGEVIRRVTGVSCGTAMRQLVCEPLGLDIWMPLPEADEARTADRGLGQPASPVTFFDHWGPEDVGDKALRNPPESSFGA